MSISVPSSSGLVGITLADHGQIPVWVVDHGSFRRWARSDDFPQQGQFAYLDGELWVDLSMEKLVHNQAKLAVVSSWQEVAQPKKLGRPLGDRMMLTNVEAGLSTEPDGMFIKAESLESGKVTLAEGDDSLEVEGSPDAVLEVVSKSSVVKDTQTLLELYWKAGIEEYWLVDARPAVPELIIYQRGPRAFKKARLVQGWTYSKVFGKSFRLQKQMGDDGLSTFYLDVK